MAIKSVLRMGDQRLLQVAEPVSNFGSAALQALLADMRDTMQALNGAGLAAPQIGVAWRVVIFGVHSPSTGSGQASSADSASRYPDAEAVPETVLINPVITPINDKMDEAWEGCLSVPGMRGLVPRYTSLRYQGFDEYGALIDRTVSGFHARVVQHECDHLDGVLYPMRIRDMRNFGFSAVIFPDTAQFDE